MLRRSSARKEIVTNVMTW